MTLTQAVNGVVVLQLLTFVALFPLLWANGNPRLGLAQALLGIVTALVYWS